MNEVKNVFDGNRYTRATRKNEHQSDDDDDFNASADILVMTAADCHTSVVLESLNRARWDYEEPADDVIRAPARMHRIHWCKKEKNQYSNK